MFPANKQSLGTIVVAERSSCKLNMANNVLEKLLWQP